MPMFSTPKQSSSIKPIQRILALSIVFTMMAGSFAFAGSTPLSAPVGPASSSNIAASESEASSESKIPQKLLVSNVTGHVFIKKNNGLLFEEIKTQQELKVGDTIKTEVGTCDLILENHTTLNISPNTVLLIEKATFDKLDKTRATKLKLDTGRFKAKVGKLVGGSTFEVTTPSAVAAVRGTVLYLGAGTQLGKLFTELYVDESSGGVAFRNTKTGDEFLVPAFGGSSSFGDGSILSPRKLNAEEREKFVQHWEDQINQALQQLGVEEQAAGQDSSEEGSSDEDSDTSDDSKTSEQNVSGTSLKEKLAALFLKYSQNVSLVVALLEDASTKFKTLPDLDTLPNVTKEQVLEKAEGLSEILKNQDVDEWSYESVKYDDDSNPLGEAGVSGNGDAGVVASQASGFDRADEVTATRNTADDATFDNINDETDELKEIGSDLTDLLVETADHLLNNGSTAKAEDTSEDFDEQFDYLESLHAQYQELLEHADHIEQMRELERDAMRASIRSELFRIRGDLSLEQEIAAGEKKMDAQTGKVFTDIHGNRVRTDQYIFRPDGDSVQILSLTLRAGGADAGISSASFGFQFSGNLPEDLKSLPWDDYLNIVTGHDFEDRLSYNQSDPGYNQYIVYEGGLGSNPYPKNIYAEFRSPASDVIRFTENYSNPFFVNLRTGYHGSSRTYKAQGLTSEVLYVNPNASGMDTIELTNTFVPATRRDSSYYRESLRVNGKSISSSDFDVDETDRDQGSSFAENFDADQDVRNYLWRYRSNPSFFNTEIFVDTSHSFGYAEYSLTGVFVPIDNEGNVLDAPGFEIRGIRDLISPNPMVNGGNYNLEVMFYYDQKKVSGNPYHPTVSNKSFSIDTIITPEIFIDYGRLTPSENQSRIFKRKIDSGSDR